jgi:hypothetical protein
MVPPPPLTGGVVSTGSTTGVVSSVVTTTVVATGMRVVVGLGRVVAVVVPGAAVGRGDVTGGDVTGGEVGGTVRVGNTCAVAGAATHSSPRNTTALKPLVAVKADSLSYRNAASNLSRQPSPQNQ